MKLEDQELLFSIFHDGGLVNIMNVEDGIQFTVDIMYLAERIKPHFTGISVKLIHPAEFYFEECDTNELTSELEELNKLNIEILKADISGDKIKVFCSVNNGQSFGYLNVKTNEIHTFDPEHTPISLEVLKTMCNNYWDDFGNRGR